MPARTSRGESPTGGPRAWLAAAALLVAIAATFGNAVENDFVFDDHLLIVDDPAVRTPLGEAVRTPTYRPLRTLSYRLDYMLGGMDPRIFHLSNITYHAVTVLLVSAVLRTGGASPWAALAGALLFAVHPVQTDAVTYASGRRDVLCGLFFAAGFLAYLRYRAHGAVTALLLAVGAYGLAILSKEMAVTLPLVCLLFERWKARREWPAAPETVEKRAAGGMRSESAGSDPRPSPRRRPVRRLALIATIAVAGAMVFAWAYGGLFLRIVGETPWHGGSVGANFATAARVWVHYLGLVVWPARLSADYSYRAFPVSSGALDPRALASVAMLALAAVPAWRSWRRGGLAGFGAAWWAATLLPVSHLIPYRELLAEHYLYIPMIGITFVVAGIVDALALRWPERRRWLAACVAVIVCAAAVRTVVRNRDWRDKLSLWTATVAAVPDCARAHFNLGQAFFERVRFVDAEREWLAAAAILPDDPAVALALATLYYRLGRYPLAAAQVESALRLRPGDPEAQALAGWIALDSGDPERAIPFFDAALPHLTGDVVEGTRLGRDRAARALGPPDQGIIRALRGEARR